MLRVTIRPDLGGKSRFFRSCPAQIIESPAFSFSQPAQLELGYADVSPDKLSHCGSDPTSMMIPDEDVTQNEVPNC